MLEAGELELLFVKSEENFADLMTKNVREGSKAIHTLLSGPLMNGIMATAFDGCDEEDVKNLVATGLNSGLDKPNLVQATTIGLESCVATPKPLICEPPIKAGL